MQPRNHVLHTLYTAHGIFMFASIMLTPLFAIFAADIGASVLIVGYLGSTFFATKAIGTIGMRLYGDKIRSKQAVLILGYALKASGWFCLIITQNIVSLFFIQCILGLSEGIQSPAFRALIAKNLRPGREVAEYANWEIVLAVTGIIGTSLGGLIVAVYGFDTLFITITFLSLLAAYITFQLDGITE